MAAANRTLPLLAVTAALAAFPALSRPAEPTAFELHRAHAQYLAATGRPSAALLRLRMLGVANGTLMARIYTRAGLTAAAGQALTGLDNDSRANDEWLALAHARLDRGAIIAAREALAAMTAPLKRSLGLKRSSLLARIQLRLGRPASAIITLVGELQRQKLPPPARYNLGIAYLRAGQTQRGLGLLEQLGLYTGGDAMRAALADQANLVLGYWYLNHQRGGQALRVFLRVRMNRPVTRKALLGLGWAYVSGGAITQAILAQTGSDCSVASRLFADTGPLHRVPRPMCRLRERHTDRRLLDLEALRNSRESQYARAVVAWRLAAENGSVHNPVVAEAALAHAYALARLGDEQSAAQRFRRLIRQLGAILGQPIPIRAAPRDGSPLAHIQTSLRQARLQLGRRAAALRAAITALSEAPAAVTGLVEALEQLAAGARVAFPRPHQQPPTVALDNPAPRPGNIVDLSAQQLERLTQRIHDIQQRYRELHHALQRRVDAISRQRARDRREKLAAYLEHARRGLAALLR